MFMDTVGSALLIYLEYIKTALFLTPPCSGVFLTTNSSDGYSPCLLRDSLSPRLRRRELYREIRSHVWGTLGKRQVHGWSVPLSHADAQVCTHLHMHACAPYMYSQYMYSEAHIHQHFPIIVISLKIFKSVSVFMIFVKVMFLCACMNQNTEPPLEPKDVPVLTQLRLLDQRDPSAKVRFTAS